VNSIVAEVQHSGVEVGTGTPGLCLPAERGHVAGYGMGDNAFRRGGRSVAIVTLRHTAATAKRNTF